LYTPSLSFRDGERKEKAGGNGRKDQEMLEGANWRWEWGVGGRKRKVKKRGGGMN
jgi:hypothetical protein